MKALRQQQREEAAARQRARDRRNLFIIGGVLATAAVAILIVALALYHASQVSNQNRLPFQTVSGTLGQPVADEGRNHVDPSTTPTYKFYPPASGPHYSAQGVAPVDWQTIATLQEGQYIHNLEHGGIAILYNCPSGTDCTTLKNSLENYVKNLAPGFAVAAGRRRQAGRRHPLREWGGGGSDRGLAPRGGQGDRVQVRGAQAAPEQERAPAATLRAADRRHPSAGRQQRRAPGE